MKVKEINQMANVAWSPASVHPLYLACGTAAQQLDASLNTNSTLNIYNANLGQANLETKLAVSVETPGRFHALDWTGDQDSGVIIGGCDNGVLYVYDANKLIANQPDNLLGSTESHHSGPIFSLSSNPLKSNLVATGSSDCDLLIWDVNNLTSPMTPGKKANLGANVTCVQFNRQAEHILASTYAGHCVIWDLKKSASIISIVDSVSRMKAKSISWNPDVATQLLLASDDDATPMAQVWDLRYANAPLKTLEGHQRGILATAWCVQDSSLLMTAAKDNKIFVWNPNYGERGSEIVCEFPSYNQWSFNLDWCKRDPSLVATASVDGTVSVYSILGGGLPPTQADKFSAIADSFPGMEMPAVVPQGASPQPIQVKNPPKWFLKPCGANFSFGGRLVSWNKQSRSVSISQVVTEEKLVERSVQLETALSQSQLGPYCQAKAEAAAKPCDQVLWKFIGANFETAPRTHYMSLLGYSSSQVSDKIRPPAPAAEGVAAEILADKMENLGTNDGSTSSLDPSEQFEMIASAQSFDKTPELEDIEPEVETKPPKVELNVEEASGSNEGLITQALLVGDLESAVDLCVKDKHFTHALTLAAHAGQELYAKTRDSVLKQVDGTLAPLIGAVVRGDLTSITTSCSLTNWKEALVSALTYCEDAQFTALAENLGERLEASNIGEYIPSAMICYVCAGSLEKFVSCWSRMQPNLSNPNELQDLVEIIMVLQRSLAAAGRPVNLSEGSTVSSLLCQYASLLAAQGALNTAVSYLNSATEGEMIELRDRLYRALGYQTGRTNQQVHNVAPQPSYRQTPTPQGYQSQGGGWAGSSGSQQPVGGFATYQPPSIQKKRNMPIYEKSLECRAEELNFKNYFLWQSIQVQQPSASALLPSQFTPSVQAQQRNIYGEPTAAAPTAPAPTMFSPAPHVSQPPVPNPPTFGVPPLTPMQPAMPAVPSGPPPTAVGHSGGLRRGGTSRYVSDTSCLNQPSSMQNQPPSFMPPPGGPAQVPPNAPLPSAPVPTGPQFFTPASQAPGAPMYGNQPQMQQPPPPTKPPAAYDSSVPRGWNDPPPLSGSRKAKQQQQQQQPQASEAPKVPEPIMCPVPGAPEQPRQFMGFQQYGAETSGPAVAAAAPVATPAAPEPASKGPLPAEHQVIQNILVEIRERCLAACQNQQVKQRLDDIGRRLEILYDKIRAGQLGSFTLGGVHQIIEAMKSRDYQSALQIHGQTVAKGNFSEMSQFMPAIKMLLQTCMQLQVFL
ncbi:protein transport protein Sec31A-like isoform X3 [Penaeus japonicus]|uniref:protein transport protein Sec31A-like isoform X3 n=1 Tax=Penaeus japonicus TaxID=27405 RepID=UPI001C70F983|nr:protein transport protein Sec31A-like isoform X3 [Penaeus japonicus]